MQRRIPLPDFLKGLAIILMIQVHITELFLRPEIFHSWAGKSSLFLGGIPAAPLFLAVMGYFVAWRGKQASGMVKRGGKLFAYGILLNIGLNFHLLIKIFEGIYLYDPFSYIMGADILHVAGLSLIMLALFRRLEIKNYLVYFFAALLVAFLTPLLMSIKGSGEIQRFIFAFLWHDADWSYFPLFPWLAYPLAGSSFFYFERTSFYKKHIRYLLALAAIVAAGLLFMGFSISTNLPQYYHHGGLFFIWAIGFLSILVYTLSLLQKKLAGSMADKYFRFLGQHVSPTYVFQWLIIGNTATAIYRSQSLTEGLFWFLGVTITTSLLVWAYSIYRKKKLAKIQYRL